MKKLMRHFRYGEKWFTLIELLVVVGVRGLEPPTSASQTLRASQLRYTPPPKV